MFERLTAPQQSTRPIITPEEKQSYLRMLGHRSGQAIESLGLLLDTPGAIARGVLAGDPMSGFNWDVDKRVNGEELLDAYNLKPSTDTTVGKYLSPLAGFATEVLTDPLAFATMPLGAGGAAMNAARKANLLQDASRVAADRMGAAAAQTMTGKYTLAHIANSGLPASPAMLATRPLVGPRLAQATTTLRELVTASTDPTALQRAVTASGGAAKYAKIADDTLGGMLGVGLPLGQSRAVFNPFGQRATEVTADALDVLGQRIGWSGPGRLASAFVNKAVGGQIDTAGQMLAMRQSNLQNVAGVAGRRIAIAHAMELKRLAIPDVVASRTGLNSFFSPQGNSALTRIIEGVPTANDTDLATHVPGLQSWVDGWHSYAKQANIDARAIGLKVADLHDPYGIRYSPRHADELMHTGGEGGGAAYLARTSDMSGRVESLQVPGGTETLRQVSLDPRVRSYAKLREASTETDDAIGRHIQTLIPGITPEKADMVARIMRTMNPDLPDDLPIFSAHPLTNQVRYMQGREGVRANADALLEALTDAAVNQPYTRIQGGGHFTLREALDRVGKKVGFDLDAPAGGGAPIVVSALRDRIARKTGIAPAAVNLSLFSVPESTITRLSRINDFYSEPAAQGVVRELFDKYTTLFKGYILAWPSRYVRDSYSGLFSNWLENGSVADTLAGTTAAYHVMAGRYNDAYKVLKDIPAYQGIPNQQAVIDTFLKDAGESGTLQGLSSNDLLSSSRSGETLGQLIPGSTKVTAFDALGELGSQQGRSWGQFAKDANPLSARGVNNQFETRNPVLKAGEKMGDFTDSINRLGGFISLLRQGAAPEYAANRVRASQVDYASLTPYERSVRQTILPWYSYESRMGHYVVNHIIQHPGGRYGQTIRFINDMQRADEDAYIPTAMRQKFSLLSPFHDQKNIRTYLTDIDIPGADVLSTIATSNQPEFGKAFAQSAQDTSTNILNKVHPLIKSSLEIATGRDFFSKRPLDEAYLPVDRVYQALSGSHEKLNPIARAVIGNLPAIGRPLQLAGALADARIPMAARVQKAGINALTGVKLQNVDAEAEILDARAKIAQQNEPYNRTFVQSYIPDELLPYVPVESQRLNEVDRQLQQELRRRWQKEKAGASRQLTGTAVNPLWGLGR